MIARRFLLSAVSYGIIGLLLGLHMAISEDHSQVATHAHIMVLTWLSFFCFGIYYKMHPHAELSFLAKIHFYGAEASAPILVGSLWGIKAGYLHLEPFAAGASIAYAISFLVFAIVVFRDQFQKTA